MASDRDSVIKNFENLLWSFVQAEKLKATEGEAMKKLFVNFQDDVVRNQNYVFMNFNP
jgi:hypothetical protein